MWRSLLAALCATVLACGFLGCAEEKGTEKEPTTKVDVEKAKEEGEEAAEKAEGELEKAKEEGEKELDEAAEKGKKLLEGVEK